MRDVMKIQNILTMNVHVSNLTDAVQRIIDLSIQGSSAYVCVSNVHMCMETYDSLKFREIVNQADLIVADGKPISVVQKLLGHFTATQIRGQDLVNALCKMSVEKGLKIGFYGGKSINLLETVTDRLAESYPGLQVHYAYSPPFRPLTPQEDVDVVRQINSAEVDILFVGIGCPKQEIWMAEHKSQLNCVMLGVGAAFDFIAGNKKHAPRWMQSMGLEWLFRLCSEPHRLWKRYLHQNPRFLYHCGKQLGKTILTDKKQSRKRPG